jgi:hypothetical protein
MIYHGHIENGHVVLEDSVTLPEGNAVTVELRPAPDSIGEAQPANSEKRARLMKFAGIAKDLPQDGARNLEHYLYGYPKQ